MKRATPTSRLAIGFTVLLSSVLCTVGPARGEIQASFSPGALTVSRGVKARLLVNVTDGAGVPLDGRRLVVWTNLAGNAALRPLGGGQYEVALQPGTVKTPGRLVAVVEDLSASPPQRRAVSLPLRLKADIPGSATPGADVEASISGRRYGPVKAGAGGAFSIPVELGPDDRSVEITLSNASGEKTSARTKLDFPAVPSMQAIASPGRLPGRGGGKSEIFLFLSETLPRSAKLKASARQGKVGEPEKLADNLYVFHYLAPSQGTGEDAVSVEAGGRTAGARIVFTGDVPAKVYLSAEKDEAPLGSEIHLRAETFDSAGELMPRAALEVLAAYGRTVETTDLGNGSYSIVFRIPERVGQTRLLLTAAAWPASLPAEERAAENAVLSTPVQIALIAGLPAEMGMRFDPQGVVADGKSTARVIVSVLDAARNPVGGLNPRFEASLGRVSAPVENENGYEAVYTAPGPGPSDAALITASIQGETPLTVSESIPLLIDEIGSLSLTVPGGEAFKGARVEAVLKIDDPKGRGLPGKEPVLESAPGTVEGMKDRGDGTYVWGILIPAAAAEVELSLIAQVEGRRETLRVPLLTPGVARLEAAASPPVVVADSGAAVSIAIRAVNVLGGPALGLKLEGTADRGALSAVVETGEGAYQAVFRPEADAAPYETDIRITHAESGLSAAARVEVKPPGGPCAGGVASLVVVPEPGLLVVGGEKTAALKIKAVDSSGCGVEGLELSFSASEGTVESSKETGGGGYEAVYRPPSETDSSRVTIQTSARGKGGEASSVVALPLVSKNIYVEPFLAAALVDVEPSVLVADGRSEARVTADLKDQFGEPYPGSSAVLKVAGRETDMQQAGEGRFEAAWRPDACAEPGAVDLVVSAKGQSGEISGLVRATVGSPRTEEFVWDLSAAEAIVGETLTGTVAALDALGSPNPCESLAVEAERGRIESTTPAGPGRWTVTYRAPEEAGEDRLTARSTTDASAAPAVARVEAMEARPASMTLAADPKTLLADGSSSSALTATVKNARGMGLENQTVLFEVENGGGEITPLGPSDAAGVARAVYVSGTFPAKTIIRAVSEAEPSVTAFVTVEEKSAPASKIQQITCTPGTLNADGTSRAIVEAEAVDDRGNPVVGERLDFYFSGEQGALSAPFGTTDEEGKASVFYIAGEACGTTSVEARGHSDDTVRASCSIKRAAKIPASLELSASPSKIPADGLSTIEVTGTVRDAGGCVVPNAAVELSHGGSGSAPNAAAADASGNFSFTYTAGTAPGSFVLTASAKGYSTVVFLLNLQEEALPPASAASVTLTSSAGSITADGSSTVSITAEVRTSEGAFVPDGTLVQFTTSSGAFSGSAQAATIGGLAAVVLVSSTEAGAVTLTARADGVLVSRTDLVEFKHGPAAVLEVSGDFAVVAGESVSLDFVLKDVHGNETSSDSSTVLSVSAPGSGAVFQDGGILTFAEGRALAVLSDQTAESFAVLVSGLSPEIVFAAPAIVVSHGPAAAFEAAFSQTQTTAGQSISVTLQLKDVYGNPATGDSSTRYQVALTGSASASPAGPAAVSGGVASILVSDGAAESVSFSVLDADGKGLSLPSAQTLVFTPGPPSALVVTGSPAASAGEGLTVQFEMRDALGNVVDDSASSFTAAVDGSASIAEAQPTALASGRASVTILDFVAETVNLAVSGLPPTVSFAPVSIPVSPGAPFRADILPPAPVSVDGVMQTTVTLLDAHGNAISNPSIRFNVVAGGASVAGSQPFDFSNGTETVSITSTVPGNVTISLQDPDAAGIDFSDTETGTFSAGAPAQVSFGVYDSPTTSNRAEVQLNLQDQYGNDLTGDSTTVLDASVDGGAVVGATALAGTITQGGGSQSASVRVSAGVARLEILNAINETTVVSLLGCSSAACAPNSGEIDFRLAYSQVVIVDPGSTSSNSGDVTMQLIDEFGALAIGESQVEVELSVTGSAIVSGATTGTLTSGAGSQTARVRFANGQAVVTIQDVVDEAVELSLSGGECDPEWGGSGELVCNDASEMVFSGAATRVSSIAENSASGGSAVVRLELQDNNGGVDALDSATEVTLSTTGSATLAAGSVGALTAGGGTNSATYRFSSGVAEAVLNDAVNETVLLSLGGPACGGLDCSDTVGIQFLGPVAALFIVNGTDAVAGSGAGFTVVALDGGYNVLFGENSATFNVDASPPGAILTPSGGPFTLSGGIANFTLSSAAIESYTVSLSGGVCDLGADCSQTLAVNFAASCPTAGFDVAPGARQCFDPGVNFFSFNNTGTSAGASFSWDFDGDGMADSASENPAEDFAAFGAGDYEVRQTVTKDGCSIPAAMEIKASEQPIADFDFSRNGCLTVSFTDLTQPCVLGVGSRAWRFGDSSCPGALECGDANPVHTYAAPGNYPATYIVNEVEEVVKTVPAFAAGSPISEIVLTPSVPSAEADGTSTVTFASNAIVDCQGTAVPDGTLVAVSASRGAVTTPDAAPSVGGIQTESSGGTVSFTVRAPDLPGSAVIAARSVSGGASGLTSFDFTAPAVPRAAQPILTVPATGAEGVPTNASVQIFFDKSMDAGSLAAAASLSMRTDCAGPYDQTVPSTVTYDSEDWTVEIAPSSTPLASNSCFRAVLGRSAMDSDGLNLDSDATVDFQTGSSQDLTAPVLTNYSASPIVFSPDGDGVKDQTEVSAHVADPEGNPALLVLVVFLDPDDDPSLTMKSISGNGLNGVTWDGRDVNGVLAPNGTYEWRLIAIDEAGNQSDGSATGSVTVNSGIDFGEFGP